MIQMVRNVDTPRIPSRVSKQCIHPTLWLADAAVVLCQGILDNTPLNSSFLLSDQTVTTFIRVYINSKETMSNFIIMTEVSTIMDTHSV
jgi:hypothetical protein